jgi:hypothetical protein
MALVINTLPDTKKYYTLLRISPYKRGDKFELSKFEPNLMVYLPLPTELRDDTTVGYTNVNLETVGDAINQNGGTLNAAVLRNAGNIASAGINGLKSAMSNLGAAGDIAAGLTSAVQSLFPAEQISSAVQQKNGVAPNPNPSVQFQGPVLRDFSFTWAFYPKNKGESEQIHDMIRKLKARALPSFNKGNGQAILEYPHKCRLNFYPWDSKSPDENGWTKESIIKIKRCFMSGVNVNYHAFGTPAFFEGTTLPVTYQLTINFKEIEYLTSDDWDVTAAAERPLASNTFNSIDTLKSTYGVFKSAANEITAGVKDNFLDLLTTEPAPIPPGSKDPVQFKADTIDRLNRATEGQVISYVLPSTDPEVAKKATLGSTDTILQAKKGKDGKWTIIHRVVQPSGPDKNVAPEGTFTKEEVNKYFEEQKLYTTGFINRTSTTVPDAKAQ